MPDLEADTHWTVLKPSPDNLKSEGGATLTLLEDGSIVSNGKHPEQDDYTIKTLLHSDNIEALTLAACPDSCFVLDFVGEMV